MGLSAAHPVYTAAWRASTGPPTFEAAPFPVRIQSMADSLALEWGLLAWEDPHGASGPASPFWAEAPMLEGEWETVAPPLAPLVVGAGARLSGLRLPDGTLILKIENRSEAAQVRMRPWLLRARPELDFRVAKGLVFRLAFGADQTQAIERIEELGRLVSGPRPEARQPADRGLLSVLDGRLAGKSWREIAVDLYGAERVAADWSVDGWMRSRVRRYGSKARVLMECGYRDLAAGR